MVEEEHSEEKGTAENVVPVKPSNEEMQQTIEVLLTYSLFTENGEEGATATKISSVDESEFNRFSKQITIKNFFKKQ